MGRGRYVRFVFSAIRFFVLIHRSSPDLFVDITQLALSLLLPSVTSLVSVCIEGLYNPYMTDASASSPPPWAFSHFSVVWLLPAPYSSCPLSVSPNYTG